MATSTITRREFVTRLMRDTGMTFVEATKAYECMCRVIADGVVSGAKISIGSVGAIVPVWHQPREVTKHFERAKDNRIVPSRRTYVLDGRFVYKFRVYNRFMETHILNWHDDLGPDAEYNLSH
jgi:nucleoid DNA-binding protein